MILLTLFLITHDITFIKILNMENSITLWKFNNFNTFKLFYVAISITSIIVMLKWFRILK